MGFHIVNVKDNKLEHSFVQNESQLIDIDFITDDTIIYQGEENWKPVRIGDSEKYKNYSLDHFKDGLKAQRLFKEQAKKHNLIVEELRQDVDSLANYLIEKKFFRIKRGDFIIRNYGNLEVEVKCKKLYPRSKNKVFYFEKENLEGHLNMQKYTKTPIIIALYERNENRSMDNKPYFISIDEINDNISKYSLESSNGSDCYLIPVKGLKRDFSFITDLSW